MAGEEEREDMSSGASCAPSCGRSWSLRPIMEEMRKGLTAEDWEPGDPEGVLREAWVAATVEDCKRLRRPLEATTCDFRTSAGEASTMVAVITAN